MQFMIAGTGSEVAPENSCVRGMRTGAQTLTSGAPSSSFEPERIASNRSAVLKSGIIDLNVNMFIGFIAAYMLGFSLIESLMIASAFYISSTAMAITSLIENRKLMLRESETVIWLMVFEDLVLIIFLALISAGNSRT